MMKNKISFENKNCTNFFGLLPCNFPCKRLRLPIAIGRWLKTYSRKTFILPSFQIRITEDPENSEILSWFSSATKSTALTSSFEISENFMGDFSPLKFAEVETKGLFNFVMIFFRNKSSTNRIPMLPSSAKISFGKPFGLS